MSDSIDVFGPRAPRLLGADLGVDGERPRTVAAPVLDASALGAIATRPRTHEDSFERAPKSAGAAPSRSEQIARVLGQTARGIATGAMNELLDTGAMINRPLNAALGAVGASYRFPTAARFTPESEAERLAQQTVSVAAAANSAVGPVRQGPAMARAAELGLRTVRDFVAR